MSCFSCLSPIFNRRKFFSKFKNSLLAILALHFRYPLQKFSYNLPFDFWLCLWYISAHANMQKCFCFLNVMKHLFASGFWVIVRSFFLHWSWRWNSPMFSSSTCVISFFTFWSLIHLEFVFRWSVRNESNFIFFQMATQLFQQHLLKVHLCPRDLRSHSYHIWGLHM